MDRNFPLRSVNHNLLPVLRALLRERSVTRAAETMGLTQPAASAALARLRVMLNDPLLVKIGRAFELSPRGKALLPEIEDLCFRLEQVWTRTEFQPAISQRSFTLTSPDYVQVLLAPRLIGLLSEQAPGISLRFVDVPVDDVTHHKIGDIDFIVSIRQSLEHPTMTDFVVEDLYEDREVAVVGPKHRLYGAAGVTGQDYENDKFIAFVGGIQFLEKRYSLLRESLGSPGKPTVVSQHYNSLMMIAAQSDCIALIPRSLADIASSVMSLRILDPDYSHFPIEVCLAWNRRHESDPAHRWLVRQIKDVAGRLRHPPGDRPDGHAPQHDRRQA